MHTSGWAVLRAAGAATGGYLCQEDNLSRIALLYPSDILDFVRRKFFNVASRPESNLLPYRYAKHAVCDSELAKACKHVMSPTHPEKPLYKQMDLSFGVSMPSLGPALTNCFLLNRNAHACLPLVTAWMKSANIRMF